MFLHELEPGTMFKLTDATFKAEQKKLRPKPTRDLNAGPFMVSMPQRRAGKQSSLIAAEITGGFWFTPQANTEYEVEVIPSALGEGGIPSRAWLTTSADPEVFLERDGKIVPGFSVLPSKKDPGYAEHGGGIFHEDGFQAEFSPAPYPCHETVAYSAACAIGSMMEHLNDKLHYSDPHRFSISDATFVELTPEQLASGTEEQVSLGCEPSENVWGHPGFVPDNAREFPYRMAGGHIHLGTVADAKWFHSRAERIIKAMDVFCGVPSVALLAGMEDPRRRAFYGRAGEFRFQKHGLEYRVLSNAWLQHPAIMHLTFNLARGAFRLGTSNWEESFKYDSELVRHIINTHDVKAAQKFVEDNAKILIWLLNTDSGFGWGAKALTTIHGGAKSVFRDKLGIHRNWITSINKFEPQQFHRFVADHPVADWGKKETEVKAPITSTPRSAYRTITGLGTQQVYARLPHVFSLEPQLPLDGGSNG